MILIRLWLRETVEFQNWITGGDSSAFWLSGILGSGKTVMTAAVVDGLLVDDDENLAIRFFFCQYDNEDSLKAQTVLRTLIRQNLTVDALPKDFEVLLSKHLNQGTMEKEELKELLSKALGLVPNRQAIVIDGFDEMVPEERNTMLWVLKSLLSERPGVKLFLSSRTDVEHEVKWNSRSNSFKRTMNCQELEQDISMYVKTVLEERRDRPPGTQGRLTVSDLSLLREIEVALIAGANGM